MASWMLRCAKCNVAFAHSAITATHLLDYFLPEKPEFPAGGSELKCPNCEQRCDLPAQGPHVPSVNSLCRLARSTKCAGLTAREIREKSTAKIYRVLRRVRCNCPWLCY